MTVTKLAAAKRKRNHLNLYIDGEFALSVPVALAARFALKEGTALSEEAFSELKAALSSAKVTDQALRLLGNRPHSKKELREKLSAKGAEPEAVEAALTFAEGYSYLDDRAFAESYVRALERKNYPDHRIRYELTLKGVDAESAEDALSTLESSEEERAARLLTKKLGEKPLTPPLKEKLTASLARFGFSYAVIRAAFSLLPENFDPDT